MPEIIFPSGLADAGGRRLSHASRISLLHMFFVMHDPREMKGCDHREAAPGAFPAFFAALEAMADWSGEKYRDIANLDVIRPYMTAAHRFGGLDRARQAEVLRGYTAGCVLGHIVVRMDRPDTKRTASLGEAFRMIEEGSRAISRRCTAENVKKHIWPTYSTVAHLWSAFYYWNWLGRNLHASGKELGRFLVVAEWFRRKGEAHVPHHGNSPVLHRETTWKIQPYASMDDALYFAITWPHDDIFDVRNCHFPVGKSHL